MNRFKLFIENFLVFGLGGVISKIVPLIMLPVITALMPDPYYFGLNDISVIIVNFGSAFAIMGMYDSMYRMFFEHEDINYKKAICSTSLIFVLIVSFIVFLVLIIFHNFFSQLFFSSGKYGTLLMLTALSVLVGASNSIISAPTRMENKKGVYLFFNILSPILSYSISIPLLINGYFIIALPLASVISSLSISICFYFLNKNWFSFKLFNIDYLKQLLKLGLPLLPNFLVYWIFSSCDRLMIAKMLGNSYAGIYAVGGKIGQMSQMIYTAFSGGWQYFSFSTMNDIDQVDLVSRIFEYLSIVVFIAGMIIMLANDLIFNCFFSGSYVDGAIVAPYLFLAPLLQMLYQVICNQFLIIKKTLPTTIILSAGAIVNVIFNYFGIKYIGIEGAALSTVAGYSISIIICLIVLKRMNLIKINFRFRIALLLFIGFFLLWRIVNINTFILVIFFLGITNIYIYIYIPDIKKLLKNKNFTSVS